MVCIHLFVIVELGLICFTVTGGGVAVELAHKPSNSDKIACLVIENSFTSIPEMAKQLIPWKGIKYLPLWFHKNKVLKSLVLYDDKIFTQKFRNPV